MVKNVWFLEDIWLDSSSSPSLVFTDVRNISSKKGLQLAIVGVRSDRSGIWRSEEIFLT